MPRRKTKPRKVVPTKPIKIAALIMTAIQNLRETKGSTSGKIIDYITLGSDLPQGRVKPQVKAALKRGIEYGVLKRFRGHYFLPAGDDLERADRIAIRFAKLPAPVPSTNTEKKRIRSPKKYSTKKDLNYRPAMKLARKSLSLQRKNVKKSKSTPLSMTSTITEKSYRREKHSSSGSDIDSQGR